MRSSGPTFLALPAFRGLTRKLIILAIASFLFFFILGIVSPRLGGTIIGLLILTPELAPKLPWQFITWPFVGDGLLSLIFALLTLWYFGSALEDERGTRWFAELFFFTSIAGAILATLLSLTVGRALPIITNGSSNGLWPVSLALLLVYARIHAEEPMTFNFIFRARAKYIAAGFLLFYLVIDFFTGRRFDGLNTICNCIFGCIYLQMAPARGLRHGVSEGLFGLRNRYYRAKRRRAAKKFQVYMRKQGKDVNIDASGRYIGLDDEDPDDRRRMN
ncbi:MAG TPA: rhomboid family intramembrane serine protease [Acidobacteriaceae bacterium]|nr:rhomboid family intramembrane serine protease [Acidobacteriaceae bacterium]